jgi:hypothetical protein
VNLRVWSLQHAIGELARAEGVAAFRVEYGVNAYGEVVIALALVLPGDTAGGSADNTARAKYLRR